MNNYILNYKNKIEYPKCLKCKKNIYRCNEYKEVF